MLPYANDFAIAIQLFKQGKRIINVFSIKLAPSHGFPDSKSRNNALHAGCCKVTIEFPAHAVATIRVFLPREPFLRANFN